MDVREKAVGGSKPIVPPSLKRESTASGAMPLAQSNLFRVDLSSSWPLRPVNSRASAFYLHVLAGAVTADSYILLDQWSNFPHWPSATFTADPTPPEEPERHANVNLRIRRLVEVKAAFGLSTTELAAVCGVSRAALYKWLSRDETLHLAPANWQRVSDLVGFAEDWNRFSRAPPGQFLYEPVDGGESLLSLLSATPLSQSAVRAALKKLAEMLAKRPLRRDEMLRQTGIRSRPLAGQLPWDE